MITLYKEKINYKYPNTGSYKAHQDITAYPKSKNHITCLIPLCNTYKMNGSIQFSPLTTNNLQNNHILDNQDGVIIDESKLSGYYLFLLTLVILYYLILIFHIKV